MLGKLRSILGGAPAEEPDDDVAEVEVETDKVLAPSPDDPPVGSSVFEAMPQPESEPSLLEGELRAAQKIQMSLVPKTFPPIPGCLPFDLYAILEPAREIGGDFYDFWLNGRDNLVLVIGDVSGKGIPAALFMAVCRTYLRAFSRSVAEPARLLEYLNNEVSRHNESCMFVTLICAVVNIPTGKVSYANAGHNPPLLRKRGGEVKMLDMAEDMPIGFMNGMKFATRSLSLGEGDSLLFYTDGMPEAFNGQGAMLGDDVALDMFASAARGGSCRTAIGQLQAEIAEFVDGADPSDDLTLLMYGQLKQDGSVIMDGGKDRSDALKGETGMFSLSNLGSALARPGDRHFDDELGRSLSGFTEE